MTGTTPLQFLPPRLKFCKLIVKKPVVGFFFFFFIVASLGNPRNVPRLGHDRASFPNHGNSPIDTLYAERLTAS